MIFTEITEAQKTLSLAGYDSINVGRINREYLKAKYNYEVRKSEPMSVCCWYVCLEELKFNLPISISFLEDGIQGENPQKAGAYRLNACGAVYKILMREINRIKVRKNADLKTMLLEMLRCLRKLYIEVLSDIEIVSEEVLNCIPPEGVEVKIKKIYRFEPVQKDVLRMVEPDRLLAEKKAKALAKDIALQKKIEATENLIASTNRNLEKVSELLVSGKEGVDEVIMLKQAADYQQTRSRLEKELEVLYKGLKI